MPSAFQLAATLAKVREHWFGLCLNVIEQFEAEHPERGVQIVHRALAGNGDFALRAFQFIDAASFIQSKQYIPKRDEEVYLDSARVAFWGTEESAIKYFFVRYFEAEISGTWDKSPITRLSTDLAGYITAADPLASEMITIATMVPMLSGFTFLQIATAFGDTKEAARIERDLRKQRGENLPAPES